MRPYQLGARGSRPAGRSTTRLFELAAELINLNTVLGHFARAEKNHRHIVGVALAQDWVCINVDFPERSAELAQQRGDLRLGLLAEMAARAREKRDVERPSNREPSIFGARERVFAAGVAQPALLEELCQGRAHRVVFSRRQVAGPLCGALSKCGELERFAAQFVVAF